MDYLLLRNNLLRVFVNDVLRDAMSGLSGVLRKKNFVACGDHVKCLGFYFRDKNNL